MINRAKYFQQLASSIDNSFTRIASTVSELYNKEAESLANLRLSEINTQINRSVTSIVDDKSISADEMESRYNATWQDLNAIATEGITNNKAKQIIAERTALMFEDRKSNILIAATQRRADNITIAKTASIENILKGYQEQDHPEQIIEKIKGELGYVDGKLVNPIFSPAETERLVNEYTREAYMIDASLYIDVLLRSDESKDGKTGYARAKEYVKENEFGYTELEQKELGEYIESQYSDVQTIRNRETAITVEEVANLMTERLTSGESVATTWKELEAQIELMPDYMQRQARDAAKAVHSQWATETGIAQWNQDKNADLIDLQERRESIASGALSNSQYYNLPLVQNTMLNLYDNQIAKLESTLDVDIKNLQTEAVKEVERSAELIINQFGLGDISFEEAELKLQQLNIEFAKDTETTEDDLIISDRMLYLQNAVAKSVSTQMEAEQKRSEAEKKALEETVKQNKFLTDGIYSSVTRGELSGNEAVSILHGMGEGTEFNFEDDAYAVDMINKIVENIVPPIYKPEAERMMKDLELQFFGYADKEKDLDSEVQQKISAARLWAQGAVIDLFMDTPGSQMTIDAFTRGLQNIKNIYVGKSIDGLKKPLRAITSGEVSGDDYNKSVQDAEEKNYQMGKFDSVYFDSASGKTEWADPSIKSTFDAVAGMMKQRLELQGVEITSAPTPLKVGDFYYPTPVYIGKKDGETSLYAIDRGNIFKGDIKGETWKVIRRFMGMNFDSKDYQEQTVVNQYFNRFR